MWLTQCDKSAHTSPSPRFGGLLANLAWWNLVQGRMEAHLLPITVSAEYQDMSLLLSALATGSTQSVAFYTLALQALGLTYSSQVKQTEALLGKLESSILGIDAQSALMAKEVEALGIATHVLLRHKRWNRRLRHHEDALLRYCRKVADVQWLRSPSVAASFLMGFADCPLFRPLVRRAGIYLEEKLHNAPSADLPVILFGLCLAGKSPQVDDVQLGDWLSRTHQPFKQLCVLTVVLSGLQHPRLNQAVTCLRDRALEIYSSTVDPNIATIRVLLAVIHMAEMGRDARQITSALESLPVGQDMRDRVSAVIRADSLLFIEFKDHLLAQAPAVEFLAFYLYAASLVGLHRAYLIAEPMKTQFVECMKLHNEEGFRAVQRTPLTALVLFALSVGVFLLVRIWWPLADTLYDFVINLTSWNSLTESFLDDLLKGVILIPVYFIIGALVAIWLYGKVSIADLAPACVPKNIGVMIKQVSAKRE